MKNLIITLLGSKKFITAILTVLLLILQHYGLNIPIEVALGIVSPLFAYIVAQAAADIGKEKAKVGNGK